MTLVLPFGCDQINNSLFSGPGSMPCVFDGGAPDFESALMADWTSDVSDYDATADDFATAAPSDASELKRKSSISDNEEHSSSQPKKLRTTTELDDEDPTQSDIVSSSTSPIESSSSLARSSEELAVEEEDEDYYYPARRRGPQMWNSRQRWKDERKRVLKMSIGKLSEIEDPELCLLRSVLVNNTIKRLHADIRNERQAKLRQRQQRMDFYAEKFRPLDVDESPAASGGDDPFELVDQATKVDDLYDETSCDEIFGDDDFLRAAIPDRRVTSSPAPTTPRDSDGQTVAGPTSNSQTSCDTAIDCASSRFYPENSNDSTPPPDNSSSSGVPSYAVSSFRRQCATQFRTNRDDNIFPPRVPILDSVVYHSLLASLESS